MGSSPPRPLSCSRHGSHCEYPAQDSHIQDFEDERLFFRDAVFGLLAGSASKKVGGPKASHEEG
jgi:hypothetical protein